MRQKKILVFHPIIAPYRIDFFNEFSKHFDAEICLYWRNLKDQKFDYKKIEDQFTFKPIWIIKEELGIFSWIIQLWKRLSLRKNDVVVVSEFGLPTITATLHKLITRSKYKVVSIVDDSYNMVAENNQFSWKHKWATKILMPFMDNVINVEPRVVEYYQQKYGKGIYMPIIVDENKARDRLQQILPISQRYVDKYNLEGKKVLLFVGRLVELKNISFAINAFLKANIENSFFVIIGDGPERESLRRLATGNQNIFFTGRLEGDELYAWYNVAQVFTLQSTQEAFGAVTNEALLGGCYCLVSKLAGSNCLIKENTNGNVIDPFNMNSYLHLLKEAFNKCNPVQKKLIIRPNLMIESFEACFARMMKKL